MIIKFISGSSYIGCCLIVRGNFNGIDEAFLKPGRSDIRPLLATVSCQVYISVITAGPYHAFFQR